MKLRILSNLFLFVFISSNLFAGGWPQPKNRGYFKISQWWLIADQHFTDNGGIDPNTTNGVFNTSFYGEYGFTNRLTGVVYFPFFSRAYFNNTVSATTDEVLVEGEAINSLGDTDIGLKYGIITDGPLAVSATVLFGLPLGNDSGGSQNNLQTGDGEFNQIVRVDAGRGFKVGKINAYANAHFGFNNRNNGFSDEWRFGLEVGASLFDEKLLAILRFYGVESLRNGSLGDDLTSTSIFANNDEHLTFAPELAYQITDRWGVSASIGTAFYGRLIYAAPSYSFGVFFKL